MRTRPLRLQRQERPRERLLRDGADTLSVAELMAIVFGTGRVGAPSISVATELLASFGSLERIARAGNAELAGVAGLGPAKTAALRAAFELGSRLLRQPLQPGDRFHSPDQVFAHFGARLRRLRQEVFFSILLDSRHRLLREVEVSRGSLNQSLVHPREVFGPALREAAAAIVVLHNHPSGDPTPSREDHEVTRRLVRAGEILGVSLLDHVVIGADGYTSFAQRGWLGAQDAAGRSR